MQRIEKVRARTAAEHDFPKLAEHAGAMPRLKDNPPLLFHAPQQKEAEYKDVVEEALVLYQGVREGGQTGARHRDRRIVALRGTGPARPASTQGGGSGFTVIYGVEGPVKTRSWARCGRTDESVKEEGNVSKLAAGSAAEGFRERETVIARRSGS